ncbi:RHS repeat-associated core domain-containing protein [Nocardioides ungokensis]|uniref:RHS repeat-associated core domain-containing protein n=1 Tax=Nocardioides ungokensis TaxID=1643322 RepID=UPI0015DEE21A|nr:RHS repeat-associated core domain-containing protein [Nocardioides ungokensis]
MTTPDGTRTTYTWDAAGRLSALDHPLLGRAAFERDASGRLVGATADGVIQTWEHREGWVVAHTVGDSDGFTRTTIDRDDVGRVLRVDRDGVTTSYAYDEACQLIEARSGGAAVRWRYDTAGRLVSESSDATTTEHTYDAAGQLVSSTGAGGQTLAYTYDPLGRRTRVDGDDGTSRELEWSPTGWLGSVTDRDARGTRRTALHVDALAELEDVDGTEVFWDTAAAYGATPVQAGDVSVLAAGPVTGIGSSWTAPGWRTARSTDGAAADPWTVGAATDLPGTLAIGAAGELTVGGLEWLGARVYDPTTRGFLSVDPLDPVPGAGWAGNPYSYAGNDPLHALDPLGLRPVTDAELKAYAAAHQGALHAAGDWLHDNWEYVAGGAMVIAGGVLIATGVGGPAGMMLVSAGADTIIQKATTGHVDWVQVGISGALGGFGGAGIAARAGLTGTRAAVVAGMSSGGISGGIQGGYSYASGPGPHTAGGLLQATAIGAGTGTVFGAGGGAAGHAIGGRVMGTLTTNPSSDTMVMGRIMGSRVIPYAEAHGGGYYNGTPTFLHDGLERVPGLQQKVDVWVNKKWINYQMMEGKNLFDVGGPGSLPPSDFYNMELNQVASYPHYSQAGPDIQSSFDLSGGVPH